MLKQFFLAVGLSMLFIAAVFAYKFQSHSELTEAQVNALPGDLRNAAIDARNTRVQMGGRTWVFALSGSTQEVTDGDVERAELALSMASK